MSTKPEARFWNATDAMFWAWQARAALAQKGGAALAAADELRRLHAENEANERNLCQLTDELAKTVTLLRQAWAVIRWQCFGECRTEGVDGLSTPSEIDAALREHLNK